MKIAHSELWQGHRHASRLSLCIARFYASSMLPLSREDSQQHYHEIPCFIVNRCVLQSRLARDTDITTAAPIQTLAALLKDADNATAEVAAQLLAWCCHSSEQVGECSSCKVRRGAVDVTASFLF